MCHSTQHSEIRQLLRGRFSPHDQLRNIKALHYSYVVDCTRIAYADMFMRDFAHLQIIIIDFFKTTVDIGLCFESQS